MFNQELIRGLNMQHCLHGNQCADLLIIRGRDLNAFGPRPTASASQMLYKTELGDRYDSHNTLPRQRLRVPAWRPTVAAVSISIQLGSKPTIVGLHGIGIGVFYCIAVQL